MLRPSASTRPALRSALAVSVGLGIGLAAPIFWSAAGADEVQAPRIVTAAVAPTPAGTPASSWLTEGQAKTAAAQVSPGDVVDVASRPTGLRYEVTLRHQDGTYTVVEVDAPTGRVVRAELADHWNGS
jgi:uncharacterized membrane protein YkoI